MKLSKILGRGNQCVVYEITSISKTPLCPNVYECTKKKDQDRKINLLINSLECNEEPPRKYAAKLPHHGNDKKYKENMKELLHESNILSFLDHPNIIRMYGMSSIDLSGTVHGQPLKPFFLGFDRLSYNFEELLKILASKKTDMNILEFYTSKKESF